MVVSLTFASDSLAGSARVGFGEAVRSDESLPPSQAASRTAGLARRMGLPSFQLGRDKTARMTGVRAE